MRSSTRFSTRLAGALALVALVAGCRPHAPARRPPSPPPIAEPSGQRIAEPIAPPVPPAPPPPPTRETIPASRHGLAAPEACLAELAARGVAVSAVPGGAHDVVTPLRLAGPIGGVTFHGPKAPYDVFDCRLVAALADFAEVLRAHGVVDVRYMRAYTRGARIRRKPKASQHASALAIDVAELRRADGASLSVVRDFHGKLGAPVCDGAPVASPAAAELRAIVCESAARGVFHTLLTPNFNADHRDHLHLDVFALARDAAID